MHITRKIIRCVKQVLDVQPDTKENFWESKRYGPCLLGTEVTRHKHFRWDQV